MGAPFALDYGSIFAMAAATGADVELLAEILPAVEGAILAGLNGDDGAGEEDADQSEG